MGPMRGGSVRDDGFVEFTDIKAPDPIEGVPPWQDPRWAAARALAATLKDDPLAADR
jgi:hypothetical protein